MKAATSAGRLLAGVAGTLLGIGVAVTAAVAPAAADHNPGAKDDAQVTWEPECGVGFHITIEHLVDTNRNWRVLVNGQVEAGTFDDPPIANSPDSLSGWLEGTGTLQLTVNGGTVIDVQWWWDAHQEWETDLHLDLSSEFDNGACRVPRIVITEQCDGSATVELFGGNTERWRVEGVEKTIPEGETATFTASSINVQVEYFHVPTQEWRFLTPAEEDLFVTRAQAETCPDPSQSSPDPGQGGELPKTGSPALPIAGLALALLAAGGTAYAASRRRTRFTS